MRWKSARRSTNIEDRRGQRGGFRRAPRGVKVGGGAIIIALLAALLLGEDPTGVLEQVAAGGGQTAQLPSSSRAGGTNDEAADFVAAVVGDTEDTWRSIFSSAGSRYIDPTMVIYDGEVRSACGFNTAATGPFYCPGDNKMYLDLSFFRELERLGAPGDFAIAYVIAHEVGHHVQNLAGTNAEVRRFQQRVGRAQANALSVRMELQADCYAGVWAHHAHTQRQLLEEGDIEEGLAAAAAVGDDRLQKMAGRRVSPESFTHGTSEQRMLWFRKGLQTGNIQSCDTFN